MDLEAQRVWSEDEELSFSFDIDPFRKQFLLDGLDDIGLTLLHEGKITDFERRMGLTT